MILPFASFLWFGIPTSLALWVSVKSKISFIRVMALSALPSLLYSFIYNAYSWITHTLGGSVFDCKCINAFVMPYFILFPLFVLSSVLVLYWEKTYHLSLCRLFFIGAGIGLLGMLMVALFMHRDTKTTIEMGMFGAVFGALSVSILYWFANDSRELCDDV